MAFSIADLALLYPSGVGMSSSEYIRASSRSGAAAIRPARFLYAELTVAMVLASRGLVSDMM